MNDLKELIGKKVKEIYMDSQYLKFRTDQGDFTYEVYGDCCSSSYFYDFYGVKNLLKNGPITDIKEVPLTDGDFNNEEYGEYIQCYGFQLTTESKEFGEMTSVFSFRNRSNGYYGGWIQKSHGNYIGLPQIKKDVIEVK